MVKEQHPQNNPKGSLTPEQESKLDELSERVARLPEERRKVFENLMHKKLLSSNEVCEILGISYPTLRRLVKSGDIKHVRVSRFIKYPREEILELVEHQDALGVPEVAKLLGVGVLAVRSMIKKGEIRAFRLSDQGHYHIPRTEVERFLKGGA